MRENNQWLNHLINAVPEHGVGNRLSMFLIALEAWRRGVTVKFYTIDNEENKTLIRCSLSYNGREHHFESSKGDLLSKEAFDICEDKDITKSHLASGGVRVPKGIRMNEESDRQEIIDFANSIGFPVVLKPISENAGQGVFSNIQNEDDLINTIEYLHTTLNYEELILEEFIEGNEYRILVINGEVVGAVNRLPANVIGDGESTIEQLIKEKNQSKRTNPTLSKKKIQLDREVTDRLELLNLTTSDVLESGERLFLRTKTNASTGGDPIDVLDDLDEETLNMARDAAKSIPGLDIAGMDFIINEETGAKSIIEINTKPMIGLHVFPIEGKARDVVKPIVDFYFPETVGQKQNDLLYFDFIAAIAPLDNITTKEVYVHPVPITEYIATKFVVESEQLIGGELSEIRLSALGSGLHGSVRKVGLSRIEILAVGNDAKKIEIFKKELSEILDGEEAFTITEEQIQTPVRVGFHIERDSEEELRDRLYENRKKREELKGKINQYKKDYRKTLKKIEQYKVREEKLNEKNDILKKDLRFAKKAFNIIESYKYELKNEKREVEKERDYYKKELNKLITSSSWRVTYPLRKVVGKVKGK
ncbi:ATP-grasp domain-containing protein [Halalkalibacillus halophilus]|uniref:ATP-grasp domain-containing protein n=1 Tax=Halalkalibacillus halophilus TaxID=392827 RepID=UPI000413145F|nr:ATP-grasp domain-containing protein [Halalkalibacillus halophilus]